LRPSDQFAEILQVHDVPFDPENEAALPAPITSPSYYLLRPDGHIGRTETSFNEADLRRWLARSHLQLENPTQKVAVAASTPT